MSARGSQPWLLSTALHLLLAAGVFFLLFSKGGSVPPVMKMRLVQTGAPTGPSLSGTTPAGWWTGSPRSDARVVQTEPPTPEWQSISPIAAGEKVPLAVPVSLDELLGPVIASSQEETVAASSAADPAGWSNADGEGYSPPPLPPPDLSPPQGSKWSLLVSVPPGGGFATSVEGLDSGHPALDRWLESYLRTVSFPAAPDGQSYQTRWILRLKTGKPQ